MSDAGSRDRVLVVDDDPQILALERLALEAAGFEVLMARDGEEALARAFRESPDIVVLDIMMPRLDGMEVCRHLRAHYETRMISVILVSARVTSTDKLAGFRAGADDYVTKPFDPDELVERVRTTLRRSREMTSLNPLTGLPGNRDIEERLAATIASGRRFALMHVDIDDFKAFNDYYGVMRGDLAIKLLVRCIHRAMNDVPSGDPFVGHVGGDDFAVIISADNAPVLAQRIIDLWDRWVSSLYEREDVDKGYIRVLDRRKRTQRFPEMTLSIGIATNLFAALDSHLKAGDIAAEMKQLAKKDGLSSFAVDRRQEGFDQEPRCDPRTVLIVDDDTDTRDVLRLHCEYLGFRVVGEASNGLEGILLARRHLPAFVLLDQRMPMLEGRETAAQLRLINPEVTIIAFTAFLSERPDWADEFLSKYDIAELTPLLGNLLMGESANGPEG